MTAKRLVDLGILASSDGKSFQWVGTTQKGFLGDYSAQYRAYFASAMDYGKKIFDAYADKLQGGYESEGKTITLSGLLNVANKAGINGMKSWLENERDHKKFTDTNKAFVDATGVF